MIRRKLGLLGLCTVVLGVMAMSAGSAQAALSWLVLNSAKTTATELKAQVIGEKDSTHLSLLAKLAGIKVIITCGNFTLNGVNLEAGGTLTKGGKVVFTECAAYSGPGVLDNKLECIVKGPGNPAGTVESLPGKGELVLNEGEVQTKIEPYLFDEGKEIASTLFGTFRLEGCALPEVNQVRGVLYVKDTAATTHAEKHLITQGASTALYVGAHSAEQLAETKIDGSAWVKLAGSHAGLHWAAMDA